MIKTISQKNLLSTIVLILSLIYNSTISHPMAHKAYALQQTYTQDG